MDMSTTARLFEELARNLGRPLTDAEIGQITFQRLVKRSRKSFFRAAKKKIYEMNKPTSWQKARHSAVSSASSLP
jgi:hypothetical protein